MDKFVHDFDNIIKQRHSVRAFLSNPVDKMEIEAILAGARRAPSGVNTQPWKVYVLQGKAKELVVEKVCAAYDDPASEQDNADMFREEYDYYPSNWVPPYQNRRRENGWGLYGLLGIGKADKDKMFIQQRRNFQFFDAPVGLFFTIDRVLGRGSLLDYGMFLENIMVLAKARGLDTCPQAAWNKYAKIILPILEAGPTEMLVCGMSLGYADTSALVNTFITPREEVSSFTHWLID
ncbi:MAG: nitroreductase [Gammaproteobacteria bacterium]|nr:nitroreductase [Gammaproteobacteria bacterium]